MSTKEDRLVTFLNDLMERRGVSASRLASDLGLSHATMSRWLSGKDIPSPQSCQKVAEYSGVPLVRILSFAGHLPSPPNGVPTEWPEFREYASRKYPGELDEDLIVMIEDLIERRRRKRREKACRTKEGFTYSG